MSDTTKREDPFRIGALHAVVRETVKDDTGASAVLRRLDPADKVGAPALHAVLARVGIRDDLLADDGFERYATCVRLVATMDRVGNGEGKPLGVALVEAEVSEQRVARLSVARGEALMDLATGLVRRLAAASVRASVWPLCEAILAERVRPDIAAAAMRGVMSNYYEVLDAQARKKAS